MLAGSRIGLSTEALLLASIYVPTSTLLIATLKPSTRATTFISAYRMLYFALLKQRLSALSTEKVIAVAEQAEAMIAQGGYMPSLSEIAGQEKAMSIERVAP
jgi:1-aminocyclopropane-1-carboxylate deaminase/D-cysteine desulfhydrase-like pyridoxal-dependent ACC family enzyme